MLTEVEGLAENNCNWFSSKNHISIYKRSWFIHTSRCSYDFVIWQSFFSCQELIQHVWTLLSLSTHFNTMYSLTLHKKLNKGLNAPTSEVPWPPGEWLKFWSNDLR